MLPPGRAGQDRHRPAPRAASSPSDTGSAVRRAQVRISGPDIGSKTALTDAQGRYEFRDLPAGRFNVSVTKSGFVTMQYGQNRPFEPGRPIELADAQAMDKADVALPRGSVARRPHRRRVRRAGRRRRTSRRCGMQFTERPPPAGAVGPQRARPTTSASSGSTACRPASITSARRCATMSAMVIDMLGGGARRRPDRIEPELRLRRHLLSRHAESRPKRSAWRSRSARSWPASTSSCSR